MKHTSKPPVSQYHCLTCKDTRKVLGQVYGDFMPRLDWVECPDCDPVIEVSNRWVFGVLAVVILAWLFWGGR